MKNAFRIIAAVVVLVLSGCASEYAALTKLIDDAKLKTRIGVLANSEVGWYTETGTLRKVFLYMRQQQVDAVVIAGGVTKNGYKDQFSVLKRAWENVFGINAPTKFIYEEGEYEVNGFKFAVSESRPYTRCKVPTFYGEGKKPLTDEMGFFPQDRLAIYAGSISGVDMEGYEFLGKKVAPCQCLLVNVYSDETVIRRMDLTFPAPLVKDPAGRKGHLHGEEVADPWIISLAPVPQPQSPDSDLEPAFPEGTDLAIFSGYQGLDEVFTLRWPTLTSAFSPIRAYSYELSVSFQEKPKRPFFRKTYLSPNFFAAEARDTKSMEVQLKKGSLPEGNLLFTLTPISPYGTRGKPITITAVIPSATASK